MESLCKGNGEARMLVILELGSKQAMCMHRTHLWFLTFPPLYPACMLRDAAVCRVHCVHVAGNRNRSRYKFDIIAVAFNGTNIYRQGSW